MHTCTMNYRTGSRKFKLFLLPITKTYCVKRLSFNIQIPFIMQINFSRKDITCTNLPLRIS